METADTVIFRAISQIRGKSKRPDKARIYNFVKNLLDDSDNSIRWLLLGKNESN